MRRIKTRCISFVLLALVAIAAVPSTPAVAQENHFDDKYLFATTRGLNDMEGVNPALKLPLFPVTVVLDVAFLPFAIIAGFVSG